MFTSLHAACCRYTNLGTEHATCGRIGAYGHYVQDAKTMAGYGIDFLKVDYCSYDPSHQNGNAPAGGWVPTIPTQLASWQQLRDALNATGRPIYTEFCPRSYDASSCKSGKNCLVPPNKTMQDCNPGERCINDGPPHEWDGPTRKELANAILTEFGNSHDSCARALLRTHLASSHSTSPRNGWRVCACAWPAASPCEVTPSLSLNISWPRTCVHVNLQTGVSAMSNLDALLQLRPQPDVDGPGFFSDGDMLQVRRLLLLLLLLLLPTVRRACASVRADLQFWLRCDQLRGHEARQLPKYRAHEAERISGAVRDVGGDG